MRIQASDHALDSFEDDFVRIDRIDIALLNFTNSSNYLSVDASLTARIMGNEPANEMGVKSVTGL